MGRQRPADRSRVGVRRSWWTRWRRVRVGRRVHTRRPAYGQHLAGCVSAGNLATDGYVRTSRSRPFRRTDMALRHDRQRLGVVQRLVRPPAHGRRAEGVLHPAESARRARGSKLRPHSAECQNSAQGAEGRLAPVRTELLPALSPGRAPSGADRYISVPRRVPLRHQKGGHVDFHRTFSSSSATTLASPTSVRIRSVSWAIARPTSTASPAKA
jgi:hypothetical protein